MAVATIYEVARRASVSPKTVSRVLNADGPVSDQTKRAVETAMNQLGYVPSLAARSMRSRKSGLVGLITGAISTPAELPQSGLPDLIIVQAIQSVISGSGKTLLISDTNGDLNRVPSLVRTFREHRVEGLAYVAEFYKHVDVLLPSSPIQPILVNCYDDIGTPAVLPDDEAGQYALTREVVAAGHSRIAYLTLGPGRKATELRLLGFHRALEEAGLTPDPQFIASADNFGREGEHELITVALDRFLDHPQPPTVICCGNDRIAMAVYGILRDRGVTVPEDMSVVGYDDHRVISEMLYPALTTVELPYRQMGVRAGKLLLEMMEGGDAHMPSPPLRVEGAVVRRGSLVAPRTSDDAINNLKRRKTR